jgi:LPXTG-motif cell wall-anchored protein
MTRRHAERSRAIRRALGAAAVAGVALAAWVSPAAAVEPTVTRNCDGTVDVTLTQVPTNLRASVHNVRIVGEQVLFELHYDWQDDPAPEQIEQRALPLPPIPLDCGPETTPPTTPPPPTTTPSTGPPPTTEPPTEGFSFSIRSECRNDTPVVTYEASITGFPPGTPMVLHWVDASGVERFTQTVSLGSGEVLWPGAVVDASGDPTDWPGWVLQSNGEWIEAPDGFEWARPQVRVFATVNPTSEAITLTYPPATPTCSAEPPETSLTTLPSTGDSSRQPLVVGGALLVALGAALVVANRRQDGARATNR